MLYYTIQDKGYLHLKTMTTQHSTENKTLFYYLLLLTTFFFLFEISFFIQCNRSYLSDFTFVSDHLHIPARILPGVVYFILAQLFIHFLFCLGCWLITISLTSLLQIHGDKKIYSGLFVWIVIFLTVLIANQYLYPNSKMTALTNLLLFNDNVTKLTLNFFLSLNAILLSLVCINLCKLILKNPIYYLPFIFMLAATGFYYDKIKNHSSVESVVRKDHALPNIFIIGVDSLRPDFLSFFGYEKPTPFFDSFLKEATVFNESVTPLARTFPSWTSILTGLYPREIDVRTNLAQQEKLDLSASLPNILQRYGYETVFATDETRFSNIGKNYGFDEIVTPPMGLNDFLIGTFNDFPLSNLLVNNVIGKWLFPYSYANRPVYFTYDPDSFLHLLEPSIAKKRNRPLFLAVHFCLPHFPYLWAGLSGREYSILERYEASIARVDKQISDYVNLLQRYHLLDHAIVVLLSDHGEALELPGDRITEADLFLTSKKLKQIPQFYPPSLDDEQVNQSAGHGTDVLGLSQYHTVLAFKLYGMKDSWQPRLISGTVSLLDIKPTLLELIHANTVKSSGDSLVDYIKGEHSSVQEHKHIFLESDFTPVAIRTVYPETQKVILEGIQVFQINPMTTHLEVKDVMKQMIINSKQFADIYGDWMLALYPQSLRTHMPILVNLSTGEWTNDLHSTFASKSPANIMLEQLKTFYATELANLTLTDKT